jgi:hypothetical protein
MSDIVKIQRPLSAGGGPWMIYDKNRKRQELVDVAKIAPEVKTAMRSDPKGYFMAIWSGSGWKIGERVEEQKW